MQNSILKQQKSFKEIFHTEIKELAKKRDIFLFKKKKNLLIPISILIIFIIGYFIQAGIENYNKNHLKKGRFQQAEITKAKMHRTITMYGAYGVQFFCIPAPESILIGGIANIMAFGDSGSRFHVFYSVKGKISIERLDFTIVLFFLCFAGVIYGFKINREYYNYLVHLIGIRKTFLSILLSRLFSLYGAMLIIFFFVGIQLTLNNIQIFGYHFFYLFVTTIALITFLFSLGCVITFSRIFSGSFKTILVISFCILSAIAPFAINEIALKDTKGIDEYQIETLNLNELMKLEAWLTRQFGASKVEKIKDFIKIPFSIVPDNKFKFIFPMFQHGCKVYLSKIYDEIKYRVEIECKEMEDNENKIIEKLKDDTRRHHFASSFFPTSFFLAAAKEISGHGNKTRITFSKAAYKFKNNFFLFYLDKKYSHNRKFENFKSDNTFKAMSNVPFFFGFGLFMTFFYSAAMIVSAYRSFKWDFVEEKADKFEGFSVHLKQNNSNYLLTKDEVLIDYTIQSIYFKSPLIVVDTEFAGSIYLPPLEKLPPGAERFLCCEFIGGKPNWKNLLKAAMRKRRLVITKWQLDGNINFTEFTEIIKKGNGIHINIGDDQIAYLLSENKIRWKEDKSITPFNPYALAALLGSKPFN